MISPAENPLYVKASLGVSFCCVEQGRLDEAEAEEGMRTEGGCSVAPWCARRRALGNPQECRTAVPVLVEIEPGHRVACHFAQHGAVEIPVLATRTREETVFSR